jgi:hypothetical protein
MNPIVEEKSTKMKKTEQPDYFKNYNKAYYWSKNKDNMLQEITCEFCLRKYLKCNWNKHLATEKHKKKVEQASKPPEIREVVHKVKKYEERLCDMKKRAMELLDKLYHDGKYDESTYIIFKDKLNKGLRITVEKYITIMQKR